MLYRPCTEYTAALRATRDGGDAVEGVRARSHRGEQVVGLADPEQVPGGLVIGQFTGDPSDDGGQVLLLQRATDAVAVESATVLIEEGDQTARRLPPQILVLRPLHHPEQRLARLVRAFQGELAMLGQAAHRPVVRAPHRLLLVSAGVDQGGQFVEGEDDVGPELMLDPDRHLRVNRCVEPSLCDRKVTPSSSTWASRSLPSAMMSSACTRVASMASTFLNPTPSEST